MFRKINRYLVIVAVLALICLTAGIASAATVTNSITYQGKLTNAAGSPLTGTYTVTFKLYDASTGGTVLSTDTHSVTATNGLFTTPLTVTDPIVVDGRALWLGINVGADPEMTPRQEIRPVSYALSLRPNAWIRSSDSNPALTLLNAAGGKALNVSTTAASSKAIWAKTYGMDSNGVYASTEGDYSTGIVGRTTGQNSPALQGFTTGQNSPGLSVSTTAPGSRGIWTSTQGDTSFGISAYTSGLNSRGVQVYTTGGYSEGVTASTGGYSSDGITASTAGYSSDGVSVSTTGLISNGVSAITFGDNSIGVNISTVGNYSPGVSIKTTGRGSQGIVLSTTGDYTDGIFIDNAGLSSKGVYAHAWGQNSNGVEGAAYGANGAGIVGYSALSNGLVADTVNANHQWGVYTTDYIFAGGIRAPNVDLAEYMPVAGDLSPGTVLIIGPEGKLEMATAASDTRVAGIISTDPAIALGTKPEGNSGEAIVAISGRVPCRVDAGYGSIHPGDLLTTSDTPGHAMKARPVKVEGIEFYRDGTVLGKALEPFGSGTGTIEVLVTLQ